MNFPRANCRLDSAQLTLAQFADSPRYKSLLPNCWLFWIFRGYYECDHFKDYSQFISSIHKRLAIKCAIMLSFMTISNYVDWGARAEFCDFPTWERWIKFIFSGDILPTKLQDSFDLAEINWFYGALSCLYDSVNARVIKFREMKDRAKDKFYVIFRRQLLKWSQPKTNKNWDIK